MKPIIFLYGPSGVGKTYLADWAKDNVSFLHLNLDRRDVDGVDAEKIRIEWNLYLNPRLRNTAPLFTEINKRVVKDKKRGAIVTLPSGFVPKLENVVEDQGQNVFTIILYGPKDLIIKAYLERERKTVESFDIKHWYKFEKYAEQGKSILEPYRIDVFSNKKRINPKELMDNILTRIYSD